MSTAQLRRRINPRNCATIFSFYPRASSGQRLTRRRYAKSRKAPSVRRAEAAQGSSQRPGYQSQNDAALPPTELLRSARSSGVLKADPGQASDFLQAYLLLGPHPGVSGVKQLGEEHGIDPADITTLAHVSNRASSSLQRLLGKRLLHSASALGDPEATIQLISQALRNDYLSHAEYAEPLRHLLVLVQTKRNIRAMVLLGQIRAVEGKRNEALALYQRAAEDDANDKDDEARADAWNALGRERLRRRDEAGAKAAFQNAADLDDPTAYFHLANCYPSAAPEYQLYHLKAATSGIPAAAHHLGVHYEAAAHSTTEDTESASPSTKAAENIQLAKEWYTLAAQADWAPSSLQLALLLRREGKRDEGRAWLERIECRRHPELQRDVTRLLEGWDQEGEVRLGPEM